MQKIETAALIGLGAIGAAYGSFLQKALNTRFSVIADDTRIQRYTQHPFSINGETVQFRYQSTTTTRPSPVDLLIIAVKNDQLQDVLHVIGPWIGPKTIIISLLNGISSEETIQQMYPKQTILYSMCVEIDAVRHHNNIQFSNIGKICFGEKNRSSSPAITAVQQLFSAAHIPFEVPNDMWKTLWWKFMFNVGINQTSAILRANYGVFQQIPEAYAMVEAAMSEVVEIAKFEGVQLLQEDIDQFHHILMNLAPTGKTSMLQDVEAGRKTEVAFFAGKVCELGEKYSIPTPVNDQYYRLIRIIEQMMTLTNDNELTHSSS